MLVRFALDPLALDHDELGNYLHDSHRRELIKRWKKHGVLALSTPDFSESELVQTVNRLPGQLRREWQIALRANRCWAADGWSGFEQCDDLERLPESWAALDCACIDDNRANELGFDHAQFSVISPAVDVEFVRYHVAWRAARFEEAERLGMAKIEGGARPEQTWSIYFKRLAAHSNNITVVDRYAFKELLERGNQSGLWQFCERLAAVSPGCKLVVYASMIDQDGQGNRRVTNDYRTAIQPLLAAVRNGGITRAEFRIVENRAFRDHAHGRYLRFDSSVLRLDTGLEVMTSPAAPRSSDVAYDLRNDNHDHVEQALRRQTIRHPEAFAPSL